MISMMQRVLECFSSCGPCFEDEVLLAYLGIALMNLYGVGLFSWWWYKAGRPSSAFIFVTLIFLGAFVENVTGAWVRALYWSCGKEPWEAFIMGSNVWPFRKLLTNVALFGLAVHMTSRVWSRKKKLDLGRRSDDGDKT